MNASELHPDDAALLGRLGEIADVVDPVPEEVVEAGKAAFRLYRPGVDVMALVSESNLAAVRDGGSGSSRLHVFEHGSVSIDVEVTRRGDFARAVGVVADEADADLADTQVMLESPASSTTVDVEAGRFTFARIPLGVVRIVLQRLGRPVMTTPWFDVG
jgi:hypothetical protein